MTSTTVGVVSAITPSVIETYLSHYLNHGPLRKKPTAHISYHEGLRLVAQFLDYASKHAVEDIQSFTGQWVPAPHWVKIANIEVPPRFLQSSAKLIQQQLGERGVEEVGGEEWWQWRRPGSTALRAEWIEMKKDIAERKRNGTPLDRAMLYIHGGAYYFGSVDEHRYQMQRHARKLKARVLAPRYRLAPQFPFPCGLHDCLASYLFLLDVFEPSQILVAGDSAGGGMVLSLLVTLRDQGIPLPAGGILLSPWVDLTHSFPSVAGDGVGDYIPAHGFHHRPSLAWPPPNADDLAALRRDIANSKASSKGSKKVKMESDFQQQSSSAPKLSIALDGEEVVIADQIQMLAENHMLTHPLVSPVQQPSLGGLPPLLIQTGGAELLHDEQVYLAHKAANPQRYRPSDAVLQQHGLSKDDVTKYDPTFVQLQVWEDLCHVPHTLSFTRPAKYMFRSVAQFGAWALAHAQHKGIDLDDDADSIISDGTDTDNESAGTSSIDLSSLRRKHKYLDREGRVPIGSVGKAGDPLPSFKDHMIRQRVDRHGMIYPLTPAADMPFLQLEPDAIGTIKPAPVRKWLAKRAEMDARFAGEKRKVQKKRLKEMSTGYERFPNGDTPPPTALAGRRQKDMPAEKKVKKSWALALWSGWGGHHDETTLERTERHEHAVEKQESVRLQDGGASIAETDHASVPPPSRNGLLAVGPDGQHPRRVSSTSMATRPLAQPENDRPQSSYRRVSDIGQADEEPGVAVTTDGKKSILTSPASSASPALSSNGFSSPDRLDAPKMSEISPDSTRIEGSDHTFTSPTSTRPHNGTVAYPFKLRHPLSSASITTLDGDLTSVDGATNTTRSTPAASMAPAESMLAEKEVIMDTYDEKEVVVNHGQRPGLDRMPSELSAVPEQHSPVIVYPPPIPQEADSRASRVPATSSPASTARSMTSVASPSPPVDSFRMREEATTQPLHANFNQNGTTSMRFGLNGFQQRTPAPPKPVGFTYDPRDLRNAMLNRQAAETAAAAAAAANESAIREQNSRLSTPTTSQQLPHAFGIAPVELPAMPGSPQQEQFVDQETPASPMDEGTEPIELSTVKQTRVSMLPPPRDSVPATPTLELSANKQTRNSILPSPRATNFRLEPTSSPLISSSVPDEADESDLVAGVRPSTATTGSSGRLSTEEPTTSTLQHNIIMPEVEQRKSAHRRSPTPVRILSSNADESVPPTPPPKDNRFTKPSLNGKKSNLAVQDSPKTNSSSFTSVSAASSAESEELSQPASQVNSRPPMLGDLSFGGSLGLS